jgi:hypothetical protein
MTRRSILLAALALVPAAWAAAQNPSASPPPASPTARMPLELYGTLADAGKADAAPANRIITTDKDWVALTRAWTIKDPPKVDFTQQLVVVAITKAEKLAIETKLDETGDLRIRALDGGEIRSGFRYGIKSMDRAGVKTVDGRPLPPVDVSTPTPPPPVPPVPKAPVPGTPAPGAPVIPRTPAPSTLPAPTAPPAIPAPPTPLPVRPR